MSFSPRKTVQNRSIEELRAEYSSKSKECDMLRNSLNARFSEAIENLSPQKRKEAKTKSRITTYISPVKRSPVFPKILPYVPMEKNESPSQRFSKKWSTENIYESTEYNTRTPTTTSYNEKSYESKEEKSEIRTKFVETKERIEEEDLTERPPSNRSHHSHNLSVETPKRPSPNSSRENLHSQHTPSFDIRPEFTSDSYDDIIEPKQAVPPSSMGMNLSTKSSKPTFSGEGIPLPSIENFETDEGKEEEENVFYEESQNQLYDEYSDAKDEEQKKKLESDLNAIVYDYEEEEEERTQEEKTPQPRVDIKLPSAYSEGEENINENNNNNKEEEEEEEDLHVDNKQSEVVNEDKQKQEVIQIDDIPKPFIDDKQSEITEETEDVKKEESKPEEKHIIEEEEEEEGSITLPSSIHMDENKAEEEDGKENSIASDILFSSNDDIDDKEVVVQPNAQAHPSDIDFDFEDEDEIEEEEERKNVVEQQPETKEEVTLNNSSLLTFDSSDEIDPKVSTSKEDKSSMSIPSSVE